MTPPPSAAPPPDWRRGPGASFGPDGSRLGDSAYLDEGSAATDPEAVDSHGIHHGVEIHDQGWFHAESNRMEQETLARIHLDAICRAVDQRHMQGLCPDARWTNDPEVFPDLKLTGTVTANRVAPFPPHDQQFYVCGVYDPDTSALKPSAMPSLMPGADGNSTWVRLVDIADHADACQLFDELCPDTTHCGRIVQGYLDNQYFVEALQAISLRPRLARQLFYCWDSRRSVYIARFFKHGTWMRVEVDDYVPVGPPSKHEESTRAPICCRSEFFPFVLWPSLVEKAYAKLHTSRGATSESTPDDRGGWEALGGGGHVEEALADLTGGVAGRFRTCDMAMDRLFIYLRELQRDTLFVCRPHQTNCELDGVRLNPYCANVVNRAAEFEGRLYVQIFCGASATFDGGLQDISVPYGLIHCEDFPEKLSQGFFWMTMADFYEYFDVIFECRLVNSGDVSIKGMPPPRLPGYMPPFDVPFMPPLGPGLPPPGSMLPPGSMPPWSMPPPGMMPPGMLPPGMPPPGMPPRGMLPPGMLPPGMPPGMLPPGMPPPGMPPWGGRPPPSMPPPGMPPPDNPFVTRLPHAETFVTRPPAYGPFTDMPPQSMPFQGMPPDPRMPPPGMVPPMGAPPFGAPLLPGMPPPGMLPGMAPMVGRASPQAGVQHIGSDGAPLPWFEWIFANEGEVTRHNQPEFSVRVPDHSVPCHIIATVDQTDPRMLMGGPAREQPVAVLVKVYENVDFGNAYSKDMVCRSNWIPVRDSMVAFTATMGSEFKILAEFPDKEARVDGMIFRCYSSCPSVMVTAATASMRHVLVESVEPPKAHKLTFVGCGKVDPKFNDRPEELDDEFDSVRRPEYDINPGFKALMDDVENECAVM